MFKKVFAYRFNSLWIGIHVKQQFGSVLGMEMPGYGGSCRDGQVARVWQCFIFFMQVGRIIQVNIKMQ